MSLQVPPQSDVNPYDLAELPKAPTPPTGTSASTAETMAVTASASPAPQTAPPPTAQATTPPAHSTSSSPAKPLRRRKRRRRIFDAPSWAVSLMVHAGILAALSMAVATPGAIDDLASKLDASMLDTELTRQQSEELVHIYADPSDAERDLASADPLSIATAGGTPSATPVIRTRTAQVSEARSLAGAGLVSVAAPTPSTALLPSPAAMNVDLSGGGKIGGDTTREAKNVGEALDQIANEILRQLALSRVTVLWMFDESGSMKDDQATIRDKFDIVINQLNLHVPEDRKAAGDLDHAIIGFGSLVHYEHKKPTFDLERIRKSILDLPVDESGEERTMAAIGDVLGAYARVVDKSRKILLVIVTDESGDDGDLVEQARLALVNRDVAVYVLGRQAMFGYDRVHLRYVDPVTKDVYWPTIRRGPETAGFEQLQWDGLWQGRIDEQASGFAPYELARLVKETAGIYFLLPNEEELRNRPQGEKAYSLKTLKEYVPDYESRSEYSVGIGQSELRRSLVELILLTKQEQFGFNRHFPVDPANLAEAMNQVIVQVNIQLPALIEFEKKLRALEPLRDKEVDRRWQANYDLALAQIVAFQVKAYEYRACLKEMVALAQQGKLVPKNPPIPGQRRTDWVIDHNPTPKAPKEETEKKYAEATRLLKLVIERHPDSPWADLAQTTLTRGLSCGWGEWNVSPQYDERAKLVPKY
jgi:hypothetical protein